MKITYQELVKLELLKNKLYIKSWGNSGGADTSVPEIGAVVSWEIEEIPPKKGLFGHSGYLNLKKINVINAGDIGTKFVHVLDPDGTHDIIFLLEKWRNDFLLLKEQLKKFGVTVEIKEVQHAK